MRGRGSPTFFFFNDPAPTEIYTLSLHDALPISARLGPRGWRSARAPRRRARRASSSRARGEKARRARRRGARALRSEEHTSELQSPCNLVCRLLLEKNNEVEIS